jgi:protein gp37
MGQVTDIGWCDSTVNPTTGCDGCELWHVRDKGPCYAGVLHEGRLAKSLPKLYAPSFTEVRLAPGRMAKAAAWSDLTGKARPDKPWLDGMPRTIFVGDMGDIFSKAVPFGFIYDEIISAAVSEKGRRHIWMLLTKQPSRMAAFAEWLGGDWPENVWAGTSITRQKTLRSRLPHIQRVPAAVRFLSIEPLLSAVDLLDTGSDDVATFDVWRRRDIDWVIVGGESGPKARPCDITWIRSIVVQCKAAGVPAFVKQLGSKSCWHDDEKKLVSGKLIDIHAIAFGGWRTVPGPKDRKGGDPSEWPEDIRVREMPAVAAKGGAL